MKQRNFRKSNAGFTLVELIVVIAIMAILAGVGTVGYSAYIKHANKGADKTLVGNIIRAVETGTNSTMFVNDESFTKGATTYPVGVIVLSNEDECKIKCTTSTYENVGTACEMCTESFKIVSKGGYTTQTFESIVGNIKVYKINSSEKKQITYCKTHTTLPKERTVYTGYYMLGGKYYGKEKDSFYFEEDFTGIFALATEDTGHVNGKIMTQEELVASGSSSRITDAAEGNALYDSLYAAYGDLSNLKLKYDGWGTAEDDGHTYATLLAYSDTMVDNIKAIANTLLTTPVISQIAKTSGYLSDNYENSADMMDSFANYMLAKHPSKSDWMTIWNAAAGEGFGYAFGMSDDSKFHHDYVYAATKAYNSGFASYCRTNNVESCYVSAIENFTTPPNNSIAGYAPTFLDYIPRTVNRSAFNGETSQTSDKTLQTQFRNASDTDTDDAADAAFEECKKLYEKYISSNVCTKNGEVFYDTMVTVSNTGSEAYKYGDGGVDGYFDYYNNYLQEMAAFYQTIDAQDGKGIIIIVTVENGVVKCEVSPSSANPRND